MITDKIQRTPELREEYFRSDGMHNLDLPDAAELQEYALQLEQALIKEDRGQIEKTCNAIASCVSAFFNIKAPHVRILGVRPLEESGDRVDELFGDYDFETALIRLWMRTAVRGKATSFGTLLSTLCHEICHHIDVVKMDLPNTYHTRGFYDRAGQLYHHVRGTEQRSLVWDTQRDGTFRINWPATMSNKTSGEHRR